MTKPLRVSAAVGSAASRAALIGALLASLACDETPTSATSGPSLSCPATVSVTTGGSQVTVNYQVPTATGGEPPVTVNCTPPPGSTFPVGSTAVVCSAIDNRARTDGCRMSVVVTQAPALTATRFLAFGDSVTAGEVTAPVSGAPVMGLVVVPSASYPSRLQERLRSRYTSQASEVSVVNAGRSSELAHEGVPRLADLLANSQTQALLLLHGYSDVLDFGANGVSRAIGAMNDMARQGRLRGARVFVGLLTPSIPGRQRSVPDSVIRDYNDRLSSMIAGEGALRVNLYGALASDVNRYIGVDGLHPTEAGYQRIAEEFLSAIGAELEPR